MPNLNLYLLEGRTVDEKAVLMQRMTEVVVSSIGAPRESVRLFLIELPKAHICVGGRTLLAEEAAGLPAQPGGPTVHVFLIAGRSEAQKEALITGLSRVIAETLGISVTPIRIMIFDVAKTDFGMNGRTAKAEGR